MSHVLNVAIEVDRFFPDDFVYMQIHVVDEAQATLLPFFERACDFIDLAMSKVCIVFLRRDCGLLPD